MAQFVDAVASLVSKDEHEELTKLLEDCQTSDQVVHQPN